MQAARGFLVQRKWLKLGSCIAVPHLSLFGYFYSTHRALSDEETGGRWRLDAGVACQPKQGNLPNVENMTHECCGEDSYCIVQNEYQVVLAVADGVGGWRSKGVDSSAFSRCLMAQVHDLLANSGSTGSRWTGSGLLEARNILRLAFWRLVEVYTGGKGRPFGSSTASVVSLQRRSGLLDTANLGDSGFLVVRENRVVLRSTPQQHRFNAPYQATLTPKGDIIDETPLAETKVISAEPGDLVIVGTDGLWDNLFETDLMQYVERRRADQDATVWGLAQELVAMARRAALQREDTPFAVEARKHGKVHLGGKMDDITVVVGVVKYE